MIYPYYKPDFDLIYQNHQSSIMTNHYEKIKEELDLDKMFYDDKILDKIVRIYCDRFYSNISQKECCNSDSIKLVALIIVIKKFEDERFEDLIGAFSDFTKINAMRLSSLEIFFLKVINWNLSISSSELY